MIIKIGILIIYLSAVFNLKNVNKKNKSIVYLLFTITILLFGIYDILERA